MKHDKTETQFAAMGMAALIPGMQHMITLMQRQLDGFREQLQALQPPARRGRPPAVRELIDETTSTKRRSAARAGWPDDPEQRSVEMKRRMAVAEQNRVAKMHPRDLNHPEHEKWAKKIATARRRQWAELSPTAQKKHITKMNIGKQKRLPVAKLEVAS